MQPLDQQIRSFLKIAEHQSLTGAAEALGISQSGLSKQLHHLERYIGQPLLRRHGRGVTLTSAGEKLYAVAASAFVAIDNTVAQLKTTEGVTEGSLRIATVHTLSSYFIPALAGTFLGLRPNVNISLLGRGSPEVVDLVESDKADVGFVYDVAVTSDNLNILNLFEETMILICHRDDSSRFAAADLATDTIPMICFPPHYALRQMMRSAKIDRNVIAEVDTVDAMLKLVKSRLGCCVLPDRLPHDLVEEPGLSRIIISTPDLRRRVVAVTKKNKPASPLLTLLLDIATRQK